MLSEDQGKHPVIKSPGQERSMTSTNLDAYRGKGASSSDDDVMGNSLHIIKINYFFQKYIKQNQKCSLSTFIPTNLFHSNVLEFLFFNVWYVHLINLY